VFLSFESADKIICIGEGNNKNRIGEGGGKEEAWYYPIYLKLPSRCGRT